MKFKQILKEIITPRFSVDELERSHTKCGCEFKMTSLFFDDNKSHYPTKILGWIDPVQGSKIIGTWNQYGECWVNCTRIKSFDLQRPTQK